MIQNIHTKGQKEKIIINNEKKKDRDEKLYYTVGYGKDAFFLSQNTKTLTTYKNIN